jgi:hypothetical protein
MKPTQHGAGGWSTFSLRGFAYSSGAVILVLLALCAAFVDYGVEGEGEFGERQGKRRRGTASASSAPSTRRAAHCYLWHAICSCCVGAQ